MATAKLPAIELGQFRGGPHDGKPFKVELELLMEQNLLLQANSGGGKSWALRRLIEQENAASLASALTGFRRELQEEHNATPAARPVPAHIERERADVRQAVSQLESSGFSGKNISRALGLSAEISPSAIHLLQTLKASHRPLTRRQLATLAGMKASGGAYRSLVAMLLKDGYMVNAGGALAPTETGSAAAGDVRPELTGSDLVEHWANKLGSAAGEILRHVVAGGHSSIVRREGVALALGKSPSGGAFREAVAALISNGLLEKRPGSGLSPSPLFFQ